MRFLPRVVLLFLFLISGFRFAQAETPSSIPNPQTTRRSWVADSANVIDDNTEKQINLRIKTLEIVTKAEIAVVTVNNLGGQSVEDFAADLFKLWGIGKKDKNNGVLVLASIGDRKARVEVGYDLEPVLTDSLTAQLQRDVMTPNFKVGNYGKGLLNITSELATVIENDKKENIGSNQRGIAGTQGTTNGDSSSPIAIDDNNFGSTPISGTSGGSSQSSGKSLLFFLFAVGGVIVLVVWLKTRPKKCPKCSTEMVKVPAEQEAPHLTNAQEYEQRLGGRDWVVWRCPKCEAYEIEAKDKWFSGIEDCTFCGNKTAQRSSRILKHPTRYSEGLEEITHTCSFPECRKSRTERRSIPRIPPPSSSSSSGGFGSSSSSSSSSGGGSFGGGRSGGGGSSSSW